MTSLVESMQSLLCVWFSTSSRRNVWVSMLAGTMFFVGWWLIIDAHAKYPAEMSGAYYVCGLFGTISLIMINIITNAQISGGLYENENHTSRITSWLFVGFVMGFAAVIAACWILFVDFITAGAPHPWPGVSLFLQNILIFVGSLTFKFGRTEEF